MIQRESVLRALDRSQRRDGPQGRRAGCPGVELSGTRHSERDRASLHVSFVSFAKEVRLKRRPKRASCTHSELAAHAPLGGRTLALALVRARDGPIRGRAAGRQGSRPLGDMQVGPLHSACLGGGGTVHGPYLHVAKRATALPTCSTSPDRSIPGPHKRERERATAERRMRCKLGVRAGRPFGASFQPHFLRERDERDV
ncbi:hypothetical protein T492DRAFT_831626 [Pavlovales sp. CCMP2436]|nr:hypothetical protein T492DRAFT_831626 [Pavlovales sp. CCMP2436]